MKKIIISAIAGLSLFAGVAALPLAANAQSCVSISGTLSIGSRGSQVRSLQQFLVSQSYPGGGAWMETGYYGQATAAAVRIFQQQHGLSQTGVVDYTTLSALENCGNVSNVVTTTSPYSYPGYPGYNAYPTGTTYPYGYTGSYNYNYNNYPYSYGTTAPTITSLSQNTGTAGQSVTIYGQGFSPYSNSVNFGGQIIPGVSSGNGTTLVFTIPYTYSNVTNESIQLSVTDQNGTSNSEIFTLNPNVSTTCGYQYGYSYTNCGCSNAYSYTYTSNCGTCGSTYTSYPYTSNCQGNTNSPTITYLTPQSGAVGTSVTVYGSGFTTGGNTVHFGNGIVTGLQSPDGQSLSFIVPSQLTGYGSQPVVVGTYNVSVTNANNVSTNVVQYTITSTGNQNGSGTPTISSVSGPTSLATGQQGTWTMQINTNGNSYTTVSAAWGDTGNGYVNMAAPLVVNNSQVVTFTHAYINPGTFTLTFTVSNSNGQTNSYTSTVYVSGNGSQNGAPSISYLSPSSGYVGTQVTIYGTNLSSSGVNTIYFGSGAIQNVYSNGNTIVFTIPSFTSQYCAPGLTCGYVPVPVSPGTYNVSVMNSWGTSNTIPFTVL